ncbi:(2Fe-2S) ferredoxin domain-containing protein [bacterium]|nr:(2Fe-2S) ferredoxin domain-containing protein [bacterium]
MAKVQSLAELKKLRERIKSNIDLREKGNNIEEMILIKVAMATCGIAAGAKTIMNSFIDELKKEKIENVVVTQTGCMGYCHSEPTVEITLPGKEGIIFGNVDEKKVKELIERYIKSGELVDGIIPNNYKTIE